MKKSLCLVQELFIDLWDIQNISEMTFLFLFGGGLIITLLVILFIFLIPLLALLNVLMSDLQGNEKIMWVLIIIFLPFLGSLLYFLIGRDKRINR